MSGLAFRFKRFFRMSLFVFCIQSPVLAIDRNIPRDEPLDILALLGIPLVPSEVSAHSNIDSIDDDERVDDPVKASPYRLNGLQNYGNTCYLNAITYLIANTSLQKLVNEHDDLDAFSDLSPAGAQLKNSLKKLLKSIKSGADYSYHQQVLKSYLKSVQKALKGQFSGSIFMQQDAAEFLELMLHALGAEGSKFEMLQREQITYEDERDAVVYDTPYKLLRLPLEGYSIKELVEHYFRQEVFEPSLQSEEQVKKFKQVGLVKTPKTLLVQLKRFSHTEKSRARISIDRYLSIPTYSSDKFGLSSRLEDETYRLKALVVHEGPFAQFGHYVSYEVKYRKNGTYLIKYDDDRISRVPMSELGSLLANDAYLLAYERKS